MAIGYSAILKIAKPDAGTQTWATYFHRLVEIVDNLHGGVVTITKVSGATTLPFASGVTDKGKRAVIRTASVLTGAVTVNVPAIDRVFLAENLSSGTGTFKVQTSGNIGVTVPQGKRQLLRSSATGVVAASKVGGQITSATELGANVITATNAALKAGAIAAPGAALATGAVGLTKIAGGGSYGRIMYTATGAGFAWTTLARGTARQALVMSTAAVPKPTWGTLPLTRMATSTGIAMPAAGASVAFTHGLVGVTAESDIKYLTCFAKCLSADGNWAVGDCVQISMQSDGNFGQMLAVDTITTVRCYVSSNGASWANRTTFNNFTVDTTKWALFFSVGL